MIARIVLALTLMFIASPAWSMRCALLNTDNEILEYRERGDASNPCPYELPLKGLRWLPAPLMQPPAYDPASQVLVGPVITIGATEVTMSYSVRAKTAEELDADKQDKMSEIAEAVVRALCNHENRIRAAEKPAPPQLTLTQCLAALKSLLP